MAPVRCWIGQNGPRDDEVNGTATVAELKKQLEASSSCAASNLDVIFCGQKLRDDIVFENCPGFNVSSVVYVIEKQQSAASRCVVPPAEDAESLVTSLQATVLDPHHRAMLTRIISNGDTVQNLIDCVPGLRQDTVAQGILKDPYLLAHWVTDERVLERFSKHPCLYDACQYIMNCLHTEVVRHSGNAMDGPLLPPPPPGVNVGDPFESEEDEDEAGDGLDADMAGRQITPQQLAAALAMAAGGVPSQQRSTGQSSTSNAPASGRAAASATSPLITPNMLQMAMQQALASRSQQSGEMQSQIQQLRDMGFLDTEENARALRMSSGDVMAAVEYIIAERERQEQGFGLD